MIQNINEAVHQLSQEGYVVLKHLVPTVGLDLIREKMLRETFCLMKVKKWGGIHALPGHLQQNPPRYAPYVMQEILVHSMVVAITQQILGKGLYNNFYSANTSCPGSHVQPYHSDWMPLWPAHRIDHSAVSFVVNIPLDDVNEENGSIELWPNSHYLGGTVKFPGKKEFDELKKYSKPTRINTKKGDVLIRDSRVYHRGMTNFSKIPRIMLSMIYSIHWLDKGAPLIFSTDCQSELDSHSIYRHIVYTEKEIDHTVDQTCGFHTYA